jgi:hypothetical protein
MHERGDGDDVPAIQLAKGITVPTLGGRGEILVGAHLQPTMRAAGTWRAVMSVAGSPRSVWASLVRQIDRRFPRRRIVRRSGGCGRHVGDAHFACYMTADVDVSGRRGLSLEATLRSPADDVTGRYVLAMTGAVVPTVLPSRRVRVRPVHVPRRFPPPRRPHRAPRVGDPLAPTTFDVAGYVRLPGSEMVAQWGTGSATGGFDVLLRVLPGASAKDVGAAYARQASQGEGPPRVTTAHVGATTITSLLPPGGAGGLQGEIDVLDEGAQSPGFIFYSVYND